MFILKVELHLTRESLKGRAIFTVEHEPSVRPTVAQISNFTTPVQSFWYLTYTTGSMCCGEALCIGREQQRRLGL